jgi:hypothetical protein
MSVVWFCICMFNKVVDYKEVLFKMLHYNFWQSLCQWALHLGQSQGRCHYPHFHFGW